MAIHCPVCITSFEGNECPNCGEKVPAPSAARQSVSARDKPDTAELPVELLLGLDHTPIKGKVFTLDVDFRNLLDIELREVEITIMPDCFDPYRHSGSKRIPLPGKCSEKLNFSFTSEMAHSGGAPLDIQVTTLDAEGISHVYRSVDRVKIPIAGSKDEIHPTMKVFIDGSTGGVARVRGLDPSFVNEVRVTGAEGGAGTLEMLHSQHQDKQEKVAGIHIGDSSMLRIPLRLVRREEPVKAPPPPPAPADEPSAKQARGVLTIRENGSGRRLHLLTLTPDGAVFGRPGGDNDAGLPIFEDSGAANVEAMRWLSRRHFSVSLRGGGAHIENMGQTVKVNQDPCGEKGRRLEHCDAVDILNGLLRFRVFLEHSSAPGGGIANVRLRRERGGDEGDEYVLVATHLDIGSPGGPTERISREGSRFLIRNAPLADGDEVRIGDATVIFTTV